jgi:simple sugar transport system permease protein
MNERVFIPALAGLTALFLLFAPWAALNRETGARSTLLLLPDTIIDFTGRTTLFTVPGLTAVLWFSLAALAVILLAALLRSRTGRDLAWLSGGLLLLAVTGWGLQQFDAAYDQARIAALDATIQAAIEDARPAHDVPALQELLDRTAGQSLDASFADAAAAGLRIRRAAYSNGGMAFAAFMALVTGVISVIFGLRLSPAFARLLGLALKAVAVPAVSILLALFASGIVILILQPTPIGAGVEITGWTNYLAGRIDTVWYAFLTLFSGSLTTLAGFLDALKFSTPLIFTGLALAFGFRVGLFNIGAPGQMVLGGIAAMLAGVYLPGPKFLVLPAAILAAALGGGLWGALPGWLKARFGASEVINTILMNYIAYSLLLFLLSANSVFAAPAMAALRFLGAALAVLLLLLLIAPARRLLGARPRVSAALFSVVVLGGMFVTGLPQQGNPPVVVQMPFKAPGSEPKSYPLRQEARIPQLPRLLGINLAVTPGVNVVAVNAAAWASPLVLLLAFWLLPRSRFRRWPLRLGASAVTAALAYGLFALLGWTRVATAIPPTTLNLSFALALAMAFLMHVLLWRTKWGYDLRAVGIAPRAAEYGGASIAANTIAAMAVSGALAGLTATHYVLGGALEDYALRQALPTNDGFDGIAVALLGANTPLGVVLAAFLFGVLKNGGSALNIAFSSLTRDVVSMILALVVLFIAAKGFLPERFRSAAPDVPSSGEPPGPAMRAAAGGPAGPTEPAVISEEERGLL